MHKFSFIIVLLFYQIALSEIKVNSIISLNKNIPEECGLSFLIENNEKFINASISIKKVENDETITKFTVNSPKPVNSSDLLTNSSKISEIIGNGKTLESGYESKGKTNQDSTTFFFQEILIGGGTLVINNIQYEITGPIDSKVRLEYLFCTGEMFLPNYKKNE